MTHTTYPCQFYLNKIADHVDKRIVLFVTCDDETGDKRLRYSIKHKIHPKNWSDTNSVPKTNISKAHLKEFGHPDPDGKILASIEQVKTWVNTFTRAKRKAGKPVLVEELKKYLENGGKAPIDPTAPIKRLTLVDTLEAALNRVANMNGILTGSTVRNLEMTLSNFKAFNNSLPALTIDTVLDIDFTLEFTSFCNGKPWSPSYIDRLIKDIKKLFNLAKIKLPEDFKRKRVTSDKTHLEPSDLLKIDKVEGLSKEQEIIRDFFLIDCETGIRVGDLKHVKIEGDYFILQVLENGKLVNKTQKTGSPITVPITPIVKRIMSKYNGKLPRLYDKNHINREIKKIAELAKIEKWSEISNHTARRTYFTNRLDAKVDVRYLSATSGVSVAEILKTYDRSKDAKKVAVKLSEHEAYQQTEFA